MSKNKKCYETKEENVWKSISGIIKKTNKRSLKWLRIVTIHYLKKTKTRKEKKDNIEEIDIGI